MTTGNDDDLLRQEFASLGADEQREQTVFDPSVAERSPAFQGVKQSGLMDDAVYSTELEAKTKELEERAKDPSKGLLGEFGLVRGAERDQLLASRQQSLTGNQKWVDEQAADLAAQKASSRSGALGQFFGAINDNLPQIPSVAEFLGFPEYAPVTEGSLQAYQKELTKEGRSLDAMAADPNRPMEVWARDKAERTIQTFVKMPIDLYAAIGKGQALGGWQLGYDDRVQDNSIRATARYLEAYSKALFPGDEVRQNDFSSKLAAGVGSMAGFMLMNSAAAVFKIAGYGDKVVKTAQWGLVGTLGALTQASQSFDEVIDARKNDKSINDRQLLVGYVSGLILGSTEALPIVENMKGLNIATKNKLVAYLSAMRREGVEEFMQEFGQAVGSNLFARYGAPGYADGWDKDRSIFEGAGEAGLIGFLTGAMAQGVRIANPLSPAARQEAIAESLKALDELPGQMNLGAGRAKTDPNARAPGDAPRPDPSRKTTIDLDQYATPAGPAAPPADTSYPAPQAAPSPAEGEALSGSARPVWPASGPGAAQATPPQGQENDYAQFLALPPQARADKIGEELWFSNQITEDADPDWMAFYDSLEAVTGKRQLTQLSQAELITAFQIARGEEIGGLPTSTAPAAQAVTQPDSVPAKVQQPSANVADTEAAAAPQVRAQASVVGGNAGSSPQTVDPRVAQVRRDVAMADGRNALGRLESSFTEDNDGNLTLTDIPSFADVELATSTLTAEVEQSKARLAEVEAELKPFAAGVPRLMQKRVDRLESERRELLNQIEAAERQLQALGAAREQLLANQLDMFDPALEQARDLDKRGVVASEWPAAALVAGQRAGLIRIDDEGTPRRTGATSDAVQAESDRVQLDERERRRLFDVARDAAGPLRAGRFGERVADGDPVAIRRLVDGLNQFSDEDLKATFGSVARLARARNRAQLLAKIAQGQMAFELAVQDEDTKLSNAARDLIEQTVEDALAGKPINETVQTVAVQTVANAVVDEVRAVLKHVDADAVDNVLTAVAPIVAALPPEIVSQAAGVVGAVDTPAEVASVLETVANGVRGAAGPNSVRAPEKTVEEIVEETKPRVAAATAARTSERDRPQQIADRIRQTEMELAEIEASDAPPSWFSMPDKDLELTARAHVKSNDVDGVLDDDIIDEMVEDLKSDPAGLRTATWQFLRTSQIQGRRDLLTRLREEANANPSPAQDTPDVTAATDTTLAPNYGTPEYEASREFIFDGAPVTGYEAAIPRMINEAFAYAGEAGVRRERKATILIGPPGAGKTTIARAIAPTLHSGYVTADDAKKHFPEFPQPGGPQAVHKESTVLVTRMLDRLTANGTNFIVEKLGRNSADIRDTIEDLKSDGYAVEVVSVSAGRDQLIERIRERAKTEGRDVPVEVLDQTLAAIGTTVDMVRSTGVDVTEVDNSGKNPYVKSGGTIHNETLRSNIEQAAGQPGLVRGDRDPVDQVSQAPDAAAQAGEAGTAGTPSEGRDRGPVTPALSVSDDASIVRTPESIVDAKIASYGQPVSDIARKHAVALDKIGTDGKLFYDLTKKLPKLTKADLDAVSYLYGQAKPAKTKTKQIDAIKAEFAKRGQAETDAAVTAGNVSVITRDLEDNATDRRRAASRNRVREVQGAIPDGVLPEGLQKDGEGGDAAEPSGGRGDGSARDGERATKPDASADQQSSVRGEAAEAQGDSGRRGRNRSGGGSDRASDAELKETKEKAEKEREARRRQNYRITEADAIGEGGAKEKVRNNIAAIRLLKSLQESPDRKATPEEKAVLVKYVGWGAFAQAVFDTNQYSSNAKTWAKERQELTDLLTTEEYDAAKASTLNAHYTSKEVIDGMWQAMQHLGFTGGRALEPSAGVGHFIGLTPAKLANVTDWTAVELDKLTGGIASYLYEGSDVRIDGFEKVQFPDNFFDLAISNVPFGNFTLTDRQYSKLLIHDYFFAKGLDKVRPGGIVAFITSSGTMDKESETARRLIAEKADLVGAIRLPGGRSGAFAGNAGTDVTTDIIFLRKRFPGEERRPETAEFITTQQIETPDGKTKINTYFANRPDMMLGEMRLTGTMYRDASPVLVGTAENIGPRIVEAAKKMPADVFVRRGETLEDITKTTDLAQAGVKEGSFYFDNGKLFQNVAGAAVPQTLKGKPLQRMRMLLDIRDVVNDLLAGQAKGGAGAAGDQLRKKLNKAYDAFVKAFGPINQETVSVQTRKDKKTGEEKQITTKRLPNLSDFLDDPDAYKVAAIENYDPETGKASKTAIFSADIIAAATRPDVQGPADALAVSLNETGGIDMARIASMLGTSEEAAAAELGDRIYKNPNGETWQPSEIYLSGDVVTKLEQAREAVKADPGYQRNVTALEAVQPAMLTRVDIRTTFGSPWIPVEVYNEFIAKVIGLRDAEVKFEPITSRWIWAGRGKPYSTPAAQAAFGTDRVPVTELVMAALNDKPVRVMDRVDEKTTVLNAPATEQAAIKSKLIAETFTGDPNTGVPGWVFEDNERAEKLEALYNAKFNRLVPTKYDGSHLTLPGMATSIMNGKGEVVPFSLRAHQKNVVWRAVQSGNVLMDHAVGAGKTFAMIAAAMEMKRLGQIQRPMFVVPNHMLEQFSREFLQAYPNAKILVAEKKYMEAKNRKAFAARIAADKWDGIVITHSGFGRLAMKKEAYEEYAKAELAEVVDAYDQARREDGKSTTVKQLERKKKQIEAKLEKLLAKDRKDDGVTFEELGVDFLIVDEAHQFKNLDFSSRHTNVKGIGVKGSQRAEDLFLKIRHMEKSRPGRSTIFATGTPMSRSMAEIYTMQRYLQLDMLREYGVDRFDTWASTFGQIITQSELAPNGRDIKDTTSFSKFVNIPELNAIYSRVADSVTANDLNLPRPTLKGGKVEVVEAELSPAEDSQIQEIIEAIKNLKGPVEKGKDNHLSLFTKGLQVSTDARLLDPSADFNPNGKIAKLVSRVTEIYKTGKKPALAQIIFLDMGVPGSKSRKKVDAVEPEFDGDQIDKIRGKLAGEDDADTDVDEGDSEAEALLQGKFNLYQDIIDRLVASGVPRGEIATIYDAKNDQQKAALFKQVREGKVRILLGSSAKMGVGTNVQRYLTAMHHVDAPWNPADVVQRDGRIIRQGNENKEVSVFRYITKRSFEAYRWQLLDRKAQFEAQFRAGARGMRDAEDIDSPLPEASDLKAAASGDPRIMEFATLTKEARELDAAKRGHERSYVSAQREAANTKADIARIEKVLAAYRADAPKVQDIRGDKFVMRLDTADKQGDVTERKEAGEAIRNEIMRALSRHWMSAPLDIELGSISGFPVVARGRKVENGAAINFEVRGEATYVQPNGERRITTESDPVGLVNQITNLVVNMPGLLKNTEQMLANKKDDLVRLEKQSTPTPFAKALRLAEVKARLEQLGKELKPQDQQQAQPKPDEGEVLSSLVQGAGAALQGPQEGDDGTPFVGVKEEMFQQDQRRAELRRAVIEHMRRAAGENVQITDEDLPAFRSDDQAAAIIDRAAGMRQFSAGWSNLAFGDPQMRTPGLDRGGPSASRVPSESMVYRGVKAVPLADVKTEQPTVSVAEVKKKITQELGDRPRDMPAVLYMDGAYYVLDGNHRITAARAKGKKTIRARVVTVLGDRMDTQREEARIESLRQIITQELRNVLGSNAVADGRGSLDEAGRQLAEGQPGTGEGDQGRGQRDALGPILGDKDRRAAVLDAFFADEHSPGAVEKRARAQGFARIAFVAAMSPDGAVLSLSPRPRVSPVTLFFARLFGRDQEPKLYVGDGFDLARDEPVRVRVQNPLMLSENRNAEAALTDPAILVQMLSHPKSAAPESLRRFVAQNAPAAGPAFRGMLIQELERLGYDGIQSGQTLLVWDQKRIRSDYDLFHPDAAGAEGLRASDDYVEQDLADRLARLMREEGLDREQEATSFEELSSLTSGLPENAADYRYLLPFEAWGNPAENPEDRARAMKRLAEIRDLTSRDKIKNASFEDISKAFSDLHEITANLWKYGPEASVDEARRYDGGELAYTAWYFNRARQRLDNADMRVPLMAKGEEVRDNISEIVQEAAEIVENVLASGNGRLLELMVFGPDVIKPPKKRNKKDWTAGIGDTQPSGFYFLAGRKLVTAPDSLFQQGGQAVINWLRQEGVQQAEIEHFGLQEKYGDSATRRGVPVSRDEMASDIGKRMFDFKRKIAWLNPERSQNDYELGNTRAFRGPRIPGRGLYFEKVNAFPKKLRGREPLPAGEFTSPHWEEVLEGTWSSIRGSVREVGGGWGKMLVGEELQTDLQQGANSGRRPRKSVKEIKDLKTREEQYNAVMESAIAALRTANVADAEQQEEFYRLRNLLHPSYGGRDVAKDADAWRQAADELRALVDVAKIKAKKVWANAWELRGGLYKRASDAVDELIALHDAHPDMFAPDGRDTYRVPSNITPETPIDDTYVRNMVRDLLIMAARQGADSVAISTSDTTARIQNNEKAAHFYDTQLKPRLEKELRRVTGDPELTLEKIALPKAMGAPRNEKGYTVWAAKLPAEVRSTIREEGMPMFSLVADRAAARTAEEDMATGRDMRRTLDALGFYSKLDEVLGGFGPKDKVTADTLAKRGVKASEIEARGLKDMLAEGKAVPVAELRTAAEQNRVQLNEVQAGSVDYDKLVAWADAIEQEAFNQKGDVRSELFRYASDIKSYDSTPSNLRRRIAWEAEPETKRIIDAAAQAAGISQSGPKWFGYSLDPSNPTYRETVIHLPPTMNEVEAWQVVRPDGQVRSTYSAESAARSAAEPGDTVRRGEAKTYDGGFRSGHFSEPNIIGHMMTSMTKLPYTQEEIDAGLKAAWDFSSDKFKAIKPGGHDVYTIDQIQSDWGQKLRDGGVRDEAKIADLAAKLDAATKAHDALMMGEPLEFVRKHVPAMSADDVSALDVLDVTTMLAKIARNDVPDRVMTPEVMEKASEFRLDWQRSMNERDRLRAEWETSRQATTGNPLVNTTDQWTTTTLRRAITQAVEADADYIAIPSGETVLSYNPGDTDGMRGFYGGVERTDEVKMWQKELEGAKANGADAATVADIEANIKNASASVGIVPKNLRKILNGFDKSIAPQRIATLDSPSGKTGLGKGFTLFPITPAVKQAVRSQGQAMFSTAGPQQAPRGNYRLTPDAKAAYPDIIKSLEPKLRKIVGPEVAFEFVDRLFSGNNEQYGRLRLDQKLIELALAYSENKALATGWHEAVHYLRHVKAFTDSEWASLVERAKKIGIPAELRDNVGPDGLPFDLISAYRAEYKAQAIRLKYVGAEQNRYVARRIEEELVARLAEKFAGAGMQGIGQSPSRFGATIDNLLQRIVDILDAIAGTFREFGFTKFADATRATATSLSNPGVIFQRMEQGKIADRIRPAPVPVEVKPREVMTKTDKAAVADLWRYSLAETVQAKRIEDLGETDTHPGPVLAYHATGGDFENLDIDQGTNFYSNDLGLHFGTPGQAETVSERFGTRLGDPVWTENGLEVNDWNDAIQNEPRLATWRPRTYPAVVNLKNPITLDPMTGSADSANPRVLLENLRTLARTTEAGKFSLAEVEDLASRVQSAQAEPYTAPETDMELIREFLGEHGYDGARYWNIADGKGWSYIAWQRNTVQSATAGETLYSMTPDGKAIPARDFSASPGFDGQVSFRLNENGQTVRTYTVGQNGSPAIQAVVQEVEAGLPKVVAVRLRPTHARKGMLAKLFESIESDIGAPVLPEGIISHAQYQAVAQSNPEAVRFHVRAEGDFDGFWFPPESILAMKDAAAASPITGDPIQDSAVARELDAIKGLESAISDQAFAVDRTKDGIAKTPVPRLDMSPEARKARAEAMGFDTSKVWYHGTWSDFGAFEGLVWLSDSDDVARDYGRRVVSVYVRSGKILEYDVAENKQFNWRPVVEQARRDGYDAVKFTNMIDRGSTKTQTQLVVLSPANIRDVNADFDPSRSDSAEILSSLAGGTGGPQPTHLGSMGDLTRNDTEVPGESLTDLIRMMNQALDMTTRQGRLNPGLKAAMGRLGAKLYGQYNRRTGVARVALPVDIQTMGHEAAHRLESHRELGPFIAGIQQQFSAELIPIASPGARGQELSEGWAEWFRLWIVDPQQAQTRAPGVNTAFRNMMEAQDPAMLTALEAIRTGFQQIVNASPAGVVAARVQSTRQKTRIERARREIEQRGWQGAIREWVDQFIKNYIDRLHPLKRAVQILMDEAHANIGNTLQAGERFWLKVIHDPYKLGRLMQMARVHATAVLRSGVRLKGHDLPSGPSLHDVLAAAFGGLDRRLWNDENFQLFGSYLVARRMNAEWDRFNTGELESPPDHLISEQVWAKAQTDLEAANPQFRQAARMLDRFQNAHLRLKLQNGFITQELFDELTTRYGYAPLNRVMDDNPVRVSTGKSDNRRRLIYQFKGSTRDFINPIESIIADVYRTQGRIELNNVIRAMDRLARAAGPNGGRIAERIPPNDVRMKELDLTETVDRLKLESEKLLQQAVSSGAVEKWDADQLQDELDMLFDANASETMFSSVETKSRKGERIVYLWEGGKRIPILLGADTLGEDVFNVLAAAGRFEEGNPVLGTIAWFTGAFRFGVTKSPGYLAADFFRNELSTWALSRDYTPMWDGFRGLRDLARNKNLNDQYEYFSGASGGIDSNLVADLVNERDALALRDQGYLVGSPLEKFLRAMEVTQSGSVRRHFRNVYDRSLADGFTREEAAFEAAFAANDVMDFSMRGLRMLDATRVVAFLNTQVQGLYVALRTMAGERDRVTSIRDAITPYLAAAEGTPLSAAQREALPNSTAMWVKLVAIGMLGLALKALYWDDPEHEEMSKSDMGHTHWFVNVCGIWWRIPKPFELAVFSNLFEAMFDRIAKDDPTAMQRFARSVRDTTLISPEMQAFPAMVTTYRAVTGSMDAVTGPGQYDRRSSDLPIRMRGVPPELQWDGYTSEFSKLLAGTLGWSPYKTDKFIRDLFANVGRDFLTLSDMTLPHLNMMLGGALPGVRDAPRADKSIEELPFFSRITRKTPRGAESTFQFWQEMGEDSGRYANAATGYKRYVKEYHSPRDAQRFLMSLDDDLKAYAILEVQYKEGEQDLHPLNRARQVISTLTALRRQIAMNTLFEERSEKKGRELVKIELSPDKQLQVNNILEDIAMREARNAQIILGKRGFAQRQEMPIDGLMRELEIVAPEVADEYKWRTTQGKNKVYTYDVVKRLWPDVRRKLLTEEPGTSLGEYRGQARGESPRYIPSR